MNRHDLNFHLRHTLIFPFFFLMGSRVGCGGVSGGSGGLAPPGISVNYPCLASAAAVPTLAQTIDQVMTIKTHTESSKTELSSGGKRPFKVWRFFFKFNFFPPMEGIFFSRRTVGSFFVTHATEGAAYITSAHDNSTMQFHYTAT